MIYQKMVPTMCIAEITALLDVASEIPALYDIVVLCWRILRPVRSMQDIQFAYVDLLCDVVVVLASSNI